MKGLLPSKFKNAIYQRWEHYSSNQRWHRLIRQTEAECKASDSKNPVIFFNASTRIQSMSQNAAYSLLASLGLQANGVPVHYFLCNGGLERCILGSNPDDVYQSPPCELCTRQSRHIFTGAPVTWLIQRKYPQVKINPARVEARRVNRIPKGQSAIRVLGDKLPSVGATTAYPGRR